MGEAPEPLVTQGAESRLKMADSGAKRDIRLATLHAPAYSMNSWRVFHT